MPQGHPVEIPLDKDSGYELNPGDVIEGVIEANPNIDVCIKDQSRKVVEDLGRIGQTDFKYEAETHGTHYVVIYKCRSLGYCDYKLKYRIIPPISPGEQETEDQEEDQEMFEESGKLPGGHSAKIPIELNQGETLQGTIIIQHASNIGGAKLYITDAADDVVEDFGRVSEGSFTFTPETSGAYTITIKNPNMVVGSAFSLTYTTVPSTPGSIPEPSLKPVPEPSPEPLPEPSPSSSSNGGNIMPKIIIGVIWGVALTFIIRLVMKEWSRNN